MTGKPFPSGCWRVEIKLPLTDLGFEPGKPGTFAAQFQRHRALRGNVNAKEKEKGTDYFWMPPMICGPTGQPGLVNVIVQGGLVGKLARARA